MKVTRRQLRKIIQEAIRDLDDPRGNLDRTRDITVSRTGGPRPAGHPFYDYNPRDVKSSQGKDDWYSDEHETFADYLYHKGLELDAEEAEYEKERQELDAMREPEVGQDWPKRSGMKRRGRDGTPRIASKRTSAERDHKHGRRKFRKRGE